MSITLVEKTPADKLDYDVDFARWLTDGDILVSADATIEATTPPVTFTIPNVEYSNEVAKVWVEGGLAGEQAEIAVDIITAVGRVKRACFTLKVRDC